MRAALLICAASILAGCGAAPFAYHSQREIPPGPGLLTGEEGAFVLRAGGAAGTKHEAAPPAGWRESDEYREFREFREFQEWRARRRRDAGSTAVQ